MNDYDDALKARRHGPTVRFALQKFLDKTILRR